MIFSLLVVIVHTLKFYLFVSKPSSIISSHSVLSKVYYVVNLSVVSFGGMILVISIQFVVMNVCLELISVTYEKKMFYLIFWDTQRICLLFANINYSVKHEKSVSFWFLAENIYAILMLWVCTLNVCIWCFACKHDICKIAIVVWVGHSK